MASARTASVRRSWHVRAYGCLPHEVEAGRPVPNNWDRALVETWADRKARRAAERTIASTDSESPHAH